MWQSSSEGRSEGRLEAHQAESTIKTRSYHQTFID